MTTARFINGLVDWGLGYDNETLAFILGEKE